MNRLLLRMLGPLIVTGAIAAVPAAMAHATGIAFVLNSADASISEFDIDTHKEIRRIPVLREPHHMALTPDGRSLVVGDTSGNAAFFLDAQTGEMQRHVPMSDPYQLQYSPDGRYLTVAGLARDQIDIYDAKTLALLHRVPAASMPSHMNYAPDSSVVYVSLQSTGKLIAIETADIVFALDSIPAVLSITRNPFLAYTSKILAVMGLRSLFFLLAAMLRQLRFLHFGLAAILAFASIRMLTARWVEVGPLPSLAVILGILAITIVVSLARPAGQT